jgi:hypothetical protein
MILLLEVAYRYFVFVSAMPWPYHTDESKNFDQRSLSSFTRLAVHICNSMALPPQVVSPGRKYVQDRRNTGEIGRAVAPAYNSAKL